MKFNTKQNISNKTVNLAGGEAYIESPKLALISLLLTSFVKDQYYRSNKESLNDLIKLIDQVSDKKFVAKAGIYARTKFGMRSISHALAGELASRIGGQEWKTFLKQSDNPNLVITDEARKIVKAIVSKNSRQVQESFRWSIFRRDNYTCQYCGTTDRPLTIDEYLCQALGGPINEENCKSACRPCNKAKGHMTPDEWEAYRLKHGLTYGS